MNLRETIERLMTDGAACIYYQEHEGPTAETERVVEKYKRRENYQVKLPYMWNSFCLNSVANTMC